MAACSNSTPLPGDNRSPKTRFLNDVGGVAQMAGIAYAMVERAFCPTRAISFDRGLGTYTFQFSQDGIDQLLFASSDVMDRARSLHQRRELWEGASDD